MNASYLFVAERARHRCEYCLAPEALFNFKFEVEHAIPKSRGGTDDLSNLALSCRSCNIYKSVKTTGKDPISGEMATLFHPRLQEWSEHFAFDRGGSVIGLTQVGRATVTQLRLNSEEQVKSRTYWKEIGLL